MNNGKRRKFFMVIILIVIILVVPIKVFAVDSMTVPAENMRQDIISVDFPTLQEDEESPFDFIVDPQNLLFETDASLYGGGVVEEGANLLFHNRIENKYDFSRYSDKLTVTNRSTVPVMVTISARIEDTDGIQIVSEKNFPEDDLCYVYLAIVDDEGNEQPISEEGEVSISVEMQDVYSFGLTGECSAGADWGNSSVRPRVTVTWHVEPIPTVRKDEIEEEEKTFIELEEDVLNEDTVSENDTNKDAENEEVIQKDIANENVTKDNTLLEDGH